MINFYLVSDGAEEESGEEGDSAEEEGREDGAESGMYIVLKPIPIQPNCNKRSFL